MQHLSRMRLPAAAAFAGVLAACCSGPLAAAVGDWTEYRNERFGFSLEYPGGVFAVERKTDAGDGQVFVASDGEARLLVGALANVSSYTPASYQDYVARHSYGDYKIEYRRLGGSWFVLSGEGNGRIFYEKVMFSCGGRLINSFAMIYPAAQRQTFDPIVERVENTFRPGNDCERAGLSPALPKRQETQGPRAASPLPEKRAATPAGKPPRRQETGERSALADRIARARGQDVYVVLRRTTPPYDRKIVRGYASAP
jgi:hypothetical protein